jgi:hypothetical protein
MALSSVRAWGNKTVVDVLLTTITFIACVCAVTPEAVD